jgi:hypothetical protein
MALMALAAAAVLGLAATVVRGEPAAGGFDPAELIVPGGSNNAQEKLDLVQSRLGQVQGDLEKKTGESLLLREAHVSLVGWLVGWGGRQWFVNDNRGLRTYICLSHARTQVTCRWQRRR